jgi:hypothetical protein
VDTGEKGAILDAVGNGGPGPPVGGRTDSWRQTVEEVRRSQDVGGHRRRARHNIQPRLCTEYVSYVYCVPQLITP